MTLKGQSQGHSDVEALSRKGAESDHMLLLDIIRKACMRNPLVRLHLILVTWKGQCQCHLNFESLYLVKGQVRSHTTINH